MKEITLRIDKEHVLYDVMNETYLRGRSMLNGDNYKEVAAMYATMDDDNRGKIERSLQRAFADVEAFLGEYLQYRSGRTADDRLGDARRELRLELHVPSNYNEAGVRSLTEGVHGYMVHKTVSEWYLVTNKEEAESYELLSAADMKRISAAAAMRVRPAREVKSKEDKGGKI